MALWVLLVWLVVGIIVGVVTRKVFKRKSGFGYIGDAILGGAGGVIGGYMMALAILGSTVGGLLLTVGTAIVASALAVWTTKFITRQPSL